MRNSADMTVTAQKCNCGLPCRPDDSGVQQATCLPVVALAQGCEAYSAQLQEGSSLVPWLQQQQHQAALAGPSVLLGRSAAVVLLSHARGACCGAAKLYGQRGLHALSASSALPGRAPLKLGCARPRPPTVQTTAHGTYVEKDERKHRLSTATVHISMKEPFSQHVDILPQPPTVKSTAYSTYIVIEGMKHRLGNSICTCEHERTRQPAH